jgi:cytidine deaminase
MAKQVKKEFIAEQYALSELTEKEQQLVQAAKAATKNAYAPYSNFHVGAAALLDDGQIVIGNNQENAAYPSGLCAERVAIFHVGANYPEKKVLQMAIVAKPADKDFIEAYPCGGCRQVLLEYQNKQKTPIELLMVQPNDQILKVNADQLLPFGFDGSALP